MEPKPKGANTESRAELEARFLSALPVIEQTIRFVSGRNRLSATEHEDFASEVKLAFIQDDYKVLAAFQGRSSLRTYLVVVIQRLFLDYRRKLWGKWHPSAEAVRLGPLAQRLETLIHRDGHAISEACEMLRVNLGLSESHDALLELASRLPARSQRMATVSAKEVNPAGSAADIPAPDSSNPHVALEADQTARRCQETIERALETYRAEDRVILRLRFEDELSVADIARTLSLDQKRLYRRIEGLVNDLRRALEAAGLELADVRRLIDSGQCHLRLLKEPSLQSESAVVSPSTLGAAS